MYDNSVMYYVYILSCADDTYYTGCTTNLTVRLQKHNLGQASKYTRSRLPVTLVYYEVLPDKSSALRREIAIKKLSRREKIMLIDHG
ncbi:GIY-YIG nuclease family protein [Desulfallas thermosapovorans]|uniref:Putative endonuclease n=1 Tax=Desulfallas thermosapovorans DSM 6562 TaxID=1121431 RepID=A0A5S4ZND3_9FIRM|nr:putative endonuclease [Desulfallas thermosapovorans DSM 6562]